MNEKNINILEVGIIILIVVIFIWFIVYNLDKKEDIRERCQSKGWDDIGIEKGQYACINLSPGLLDAKGVGE